MLLETSGYVSSLVFRGRQTTAREGEDVTSGTRYQKFDENTKVCDIKKALSIWPIKQVRENRKARAEKKSDPSQKKEEEEQNT